MYKTEVTEGFARLRSCAIAQMRGSLGESIVL